jgi:anaerobic selenocysteine-containing dehydrogenase
VLRTPGKLVGHLSISPFGNETNRHADLLFPERIPLEDWGLAPLRWWDNNWNEKEADFTLQQPIPNAPKGVRSGYDVLMDISETIGMKGVAQTLGRTREERIKRKMDSLSPLASTEGENILYRSEIYPIPIIFRDRSEFIDQNSNAVSEEFTSEIQAEPIPPIVYPDPDSIQLITHDSNVMNDKLANAKWLSEISHENALIINPADARKHGIRQGDEVRIETDGRMMVASADLREGIRPGVVSLAKGFGHKHYGKVAKGEHWRTDDPDMWLIWWGQYGNGVNANLITSGRPVKVKLVKV